jgi:outer membrane protein assembly factor BamB
MQLRQRTDPSSGIALSLVTFLALVLAGASGSATPVENWPTYGGDLTRTGFSATPVPAVAFRGGWFAPVEGQVTSQPLVASNVPARGTYTVYLATSAGRVYAFAPNGYVRWRVNLGQLAHECTQLRGWGITGTGVIDAETGALYVVDAWGRLHALDLASGREFDGWPIRLYEEFEKELVWGAMTIVGRTIYAATGAYCDAPMIAKVFAVSLESRDLKTWEPVPESLGGGGGIWGWGGISYSPARNSLLVVTGNAFEGGSNAGSEFREHAGYGEHLVELSPALEVRAASHPASVNQKLDLDFVGSPVVFTRPPCGELAVAANKNGSLYGWRTDRIADGPAFELQLQPTDPFRPLLTQPAYSPRTQSIYVVTFDRVVRAAVGADCRATVVWSRPLAVSSLHGSPTIAADEVWVTISTRPTALLSIDARTGAVRRRIELGATTLVAPTIVNGSVFLGAMHGFPARSPKSAAGPASPVRVHRSFLDERHGWESRETGVYATDNGGRSWRRVFPKPAVRVARTSKLSGVISVGDLTTGCRCSTRRLITRDGGKTWIRTTAVGERFAGAGRNLYWWSGRVLSRVESWPAGPLRAKTVLEIEDGVIASVAVAAQAAVVLVSSRVDGAGWDNVPRLIVLRESQEPAMVRLPRAAGSVLAGTLALDWPRIEVRGARYDEGRSRITWRSADAGATWELIAAEADARRP